MKRAKLLISVLLCIALMLAVTACGSNTESGSGEGTQTDKQTETKTKEPAEYDIASNLRLAGGDEKILDTDYFRIILPRGTSWDYTVDSKTSITIYQL